MIPRLRLFGLLIAAAGCRDAASDLEVLVYRSAAPSPSPFADLALYRVGLTSGNLRAVLGSADFSTTRYATPHPPRLEVPASGTLSVRAAAVTTAGDTLGVTETSTVLAPETRYGVVILVDSARLQLLCEATLTAMAIRTPRQPGVRESLWVSMSGLTRGSTC